MAGPGAGTSTRGADQRGIDAGSRETSGRGLDAANPGRPAAAVDKAPTQDASSVGVWAFKAGDFKKNPNSGWTHAIGVKSLQELIEELRDAELRGKVSKLAIVAHGDAGGVVQLEPPLTTHNVESFAKELAQLRDFLTPNGRLMLMSCVAGAGKEGTQLLAALSSRLSGRDVIAFIVNGSIRARGLAGDVFEGGRGSTGMNPALFKNEPRMTEESQYAKWARDGRLVRVPQIEELSILKGRWRVAMATVNAKRAAQLEGAFATITNDALELTKSAPGLASATHRLDLTQRPRTIDLTFVAGKEKGKKAQGILRFGERDFDSLTICLAGPEQDRPVDFTSPANGRRTLLELTRAPADR